MLTQQMFDGLIYPIVEQVMEGQQPIHVHIHLTCGACVMTNTTAMKDEQGRQYDEQIAGIQQRIEQTRNQLSQLQKQLCVAIVAHIPDAIQNMCERAWRENDEITQSLPQEQDIEFMRDMNQAMRKAAEVAEKRVHDIRTWVFLRPLPEGFRTDYSVRNALLRTAHDQILTLFQELLGYAGEILFKYGYIQHDSPLWDFRGTERPLYDNVPPLNGQIRNGLHAYNEAMKAFIELHAEHLRLSRQRNKAEVNRRWEKAQAAC